VSSLAKRLWSSVAGNTADRADTMESANQFISWSSKPYHSQFLDWLYDQADAPLDTRLAHVDLIAYTSRANTFKEIRRYLLDQDARARSALDREHE